MNNEILVLGNGYIGQKIVDHLDCRVSVSKFSNYPQILEELKGSKAKVIINAIGYGGITNVDDCEYYKEKTFQTNTYLPILIAEACRELSLKLVHISSGCLFDPPEKFLPINEKYQPDYYGLTYSRSKSYAESALRWSDQDILILRPRMPIDSEPHNKNLITKLVKYRRIFNLPNSVTHIKDFLRAIEHLIKIDATGVYNCVNPGATTHSQILDLYKEHGDKDYEYELVLYEKMGIRRTNLILSPNKLLETGFEMDSIEKLLPWLLKEYAYKESLTHV